jgi:hypothetical protein
LATPLPEGFQVDPDWTAEDIERAAIGIVRGAPGTSGASTSAERAEIDRWIGIIKKHVKDALAEKMNFGEERDVVLKAITRNVVLRPLLDGKNFGEDLNTVLSKEYLSLSYAQLKGILARTLPPGTDVDKWIEQKVREVHEERIAQANRIHARLIAEKLGEEQKILLDLLQLALDIGGIIEPTPFCDL